MTTVLPAKLAGVRRMNAPLFTADQDVNRQTWQELTAMGISAVEFQTTEIRVWMRDNTRRDYLQAKAPSAVARWVAGKGVAVYGPLCPSELRAQIAHSDSELAGFEQAAARCMQAGTRLWVRYGGKARDGEVTEREITPLEWSPMGLIAHCHMRNEKRTFVVNRVIEFKEVK